jgi:hypothetical protein
MRIDFLDMRSLRRRRRISKVRIPAQKQRVHGKAKEAQHCCGPKKGKTL